MDAAATGVNDERVPRAPFEIWAAGDGRALITEYRDWLGRCSRYRVTTTNKDHEDHTVTTVVEADSAGGADAAVEATRSFAATADSRSPSSTYHVIYYAMRGLLLECSTNMRSTDVDLPSVPTTRSTRCGFSRIPARAAAPQRFRYFLSTRPGAGSVSDYFDDAWLRADPHRLDTGGHESTFDAFFEDTLRRIGVSTAQFR